VGCAPEIAESNFPGKFNAPSQKNYLYWLNIRYPNAGFAAVKDQTG
jgi:hypothetical protein